MKCPHCNTSINIEMEEVESFVLPSKEPPPKKGFDLAYGECPECQNPIILITWGMYKKTKNSEGNEYYVAENVLYEEFLYPKYLTRKIEKEVPERYHKDFEEACAVISISPKASAALSRRILQDVLREKFHIKKSSLDKEIEEFINSKEVPSFLKQAVDAVRNIGNFAAHPLKDTNTGEIVDVESGEADWLLDVIEALFDFAFVQPIRLEERKKNLNQKLKSLGKPPMKDAPTGI